MLTVLGGVLTGSAGENLENIDDDPSPYYTESQDGSATFTYVDEDRKGSVAFQVLVSLDYVDSDADGYVDGCSDFNVTVTDADGNDVTEDVISRGCAFDEWTEEDQIHDGLVISAYVCETFYSDANCTINSDYTVSVTDSNNESVDFTLFDNDAYAVLMITAIGEDIGSLLGGLGLSSAACCCGIPIGLFSGSVSKDSSLHKIINIIHPIIGGINKSCHQPLLFVSCNLLDPTAKTGIIVNKIHNNSINL